MSLTCYWRRPLFCVAASEESLALFSNSCSIKVQSRIIWPISPSDRKHCSLHIYGTMYFGALRRKHSASICRLEKQWIPTVTVTFCLHVQDFTRHRCTTAVQWFPTWGTRTPKGMNQNIQGYAKKNENWRKRAIVGLFVYSYNIYSISEITATTLITNNLLVCRVQFI